MTVQINYKNSDLKKTTNNLVLFVGEKFDIAGLNKHISKDELSYISDLLKTSDLKKDILSFKINSKKTIFLVSIKKDIKISGIENLGAKFLSYLNHDQKKEYYNIHKIESFNEIENFKIKKVISNTELNKNNSNFFKNIKYQSISFKEIIIKNLDAIMRLESPKIIEPIYISNNKILN